MPDQCWSTPTPLSATRAFRMSANSILGRSRHTATAIADSRVLVIGGDSEGTIEIFNGQEFELTAATLAAPRAAHSAIVLQNGRVLIVGGVSVDGTPLRSAEIFDPNSRTVSLLGSQMHAPRRYPDLRMLPDGKVQVIGGADEATIERD